MVKGFKKTLSFVLALIFAFGAMPMIAGVFAFAAATDFESISISSASAPLYVGHTRQLTLSGAYIVDGVAKSEAITENVSWSSSDTSVLTVSDSGLVSAIALHNGKTTKVTVKAFYKNPVAGNTLEASTVISVTVAPVYVASVAWKFTNAAGEKINAVLSGNEYSFKDKYTVLPSTATNKDVVVTCEPALALEIVNKNQTFKVNDKIGDGGVVLTIKSTDGTEVSDTMTLKVYNAEDVRPTAVRWTWEGRETSGITKLNYYEPNTNKVIAKYPYEYKEGDVTIREYKYTPAYANDAAVKSVEFKSSDNRVVTFDESKKLLVPKGNGYAEITITVTNDIGEEFSDKMGVVVTGAPYTPATGVEMTSKDKDGKFTFVKEYSLYYTDTIEFGFNLKDDKRFSTDVAATFYDAKGELLPGCEVTWTSSDDNVITIDEKGKATCTGSGTATITLTITDNGEEYTATCKINAKIRWWQWILKIILGWIADLF